MYGYLVLENKNSKIQKLEFIPYYLHDLLSEKNNKTFVDFMNRKVDIELTLIPNLSLWTKEVIYPFGTCSSFSGFEGIEICIEILNTKSSTVESFKEKLIKDERGLLMIPCNQFKLKEKSIFRGMFRF